MTGRSIAMAVLALLATVHPAAAGDRYPVRGLVIQVDASALTFVASIEPIPGFMDAMAMPFRVRTAAELAGITPGVEVDFTLVVDAGASHAEDLRPRRSQSLEQDPLTARRLALMRLVASGRTPARLRVGDEVPPFTLVDHEHQPVSIGDFRGKVVALSFTYTTCQLPDFCLRLVNHFSVVQQRLADALGTDLVLLTLTFDPVRDQPDVLARYASQWSPVHQAWRFLTGAPDDVRRVLEWFGVTAYQHGGLLDHSLRTAIIGRDGRLAARLEGNEYSSDQLTDLIRAQLGRR